LGQRRMNSQKIQEVNFVKNIIFMLNNFFIVTKRRSSRKRTIVSEEIGSDLMSFDSPANTGIIFNIIFYAMKACNLIFCSPKKEEDFKFQANYSRSVIVILQTSSLLP